MFFSLPYFIDMDDAKKRYFTFTTLGPTISSIASTNMGSECLSLSTTDLTMCRVQDGAQ